MLVLLIDFQIIRLKHGVLHKKINTGDLDL